MARRVKILDNNDPNSEYTSDLVLRTVNSKPMLTFELAYYYTDVDWGIIDVAFAESPVPEPSVLVGLLSMAVMGLVIYRQCRNRAA